MSERKKRRLPHFLFGATPSLWRTLRKRYGGVDSQFRSRAALIKFGMWSLAPERCLESWRFGRAIEQTQLHPSPVFIIGYWQSGHSLMHYLMANDPQFATTSLLHCALPSCWATVEPLARRILQRGRGKNRIVDSLPMSADGPQGDELAMANLTELSVYHGYSFSPSYEALFRRSVLFENVSSDERREWQQCYRRLLQKVAWDTGRSRVLSRNAAHTGRVRYLLELFPNAKFIHLHRNPYRVFAAQEPKWRSLCGQWALQTPNIEQLVADTVRLYPVLMKRLLADRELIPAGQFTDVRYEELLANPVDTLQRAYAELGLSGFDELQKNLEVSGGLQLGRLAGHDVVLTQEQSEVVRREWRFAFDAFGYSLDSPQATEPEALPANE